MTDMAIAKLDKELKQMKGSKNLDWKISGMMEAVHDALVGFCRQTEEFAQAVVQGGSFAECMAAVAKWVGSSISDLDAYRRAVQFYFPGADIRVKMTVNLMASVEEDAHQSAAAPVVLDLFDLLQGGA